VAHPHHPPVPIRVRVRVRVRWVIRIIILRRFVRENITPLCSGDDCELIPLKGSVTILIKIRKKPMCLSLDVSVIRIGA